MAIALPQIALLPNLVGLLGGIFQATGLQSVGDFFQRAKALIQSNDLLDPNAVKALIADLDSFIPTLGALDPNGGFAKIKAEVDKYGAIVEGVVSGQPQTIADVYETLPNGEKVEMLLVLTVKNAPAAAVAAPIAN